MAKPNAAETAKTADMTEPTEITWYVLDTTATTGPREHEQVVDGNIQSFTFERGKPHSLAQAVAVKFLKHAGFVRTDAQGKRIEYQRAPKQPEELGAGERLVLGEDETVARYDELANGALLQRALELPGGEQFAKGAEKPSRAALITFIVGAKATARKQNASLEPDVDRDGYTPEADLEDEAA